MAKLIQTDATVLHLSSKKNTHKNRKKYTTTRKKGGQVSFSWRVLTSRDKK